MTNLVKKGIIQWKETGTRQFGADVLKYFANNIEGEKKENEKNVPAICLNTNYDVTPETLEKHYSIVNFSSHKPLNEINSINWFIPNFINPYGGGHYNIFRFANFFSSLGIENRIIVYNSNKDDGKKRILDAIFPEADLKVFFQRGSNYNFEDYIPDCDISVGTTWQSVYSLVNYNKTRKKYYFIQDFEPYFYPAGSTYALAESTYRWNIPAITFGRWLSSLYTNIYHTEAQDYIPCADPVFFPAEDSPRKEVKRIFFFSRPISERRAFELGISTLEKLFKKHPDIEIVMAGSTIPMKNYSIPFPYRDLGSLTLEGTAELYRTCDIGLCFSITNLSFLPMELMASGCIPVTNVGVTTEWHLKDGKNCLLAVPYPSAILFKLEQAISDYELRKRIYKGGLELVKSTSWPDQFKRVMDYIRTGEYQK